MGNEFDSAGAVDETVQLTVELERVVAYADAQERKVGQLQSALESRVVVEQAIGMLAERFDVTFVEAFELLRAGARNTRQEVRSIADGMRVSRLTPPEIADLLPSAASEPSLPLRCPNCGAVVPN